MTYIALILSALFLVGCSQINVELPEGSSNNSISITYNQDKDVDITPTTSVAQGSASATGTAATTNGGLNE